MITQSSTVVTINTSEQRRANSRVLLNAESKVKMWDASKGLSKAASKSVDRHYKKVYKRGLGKTLKKMK